MKTQKNVGLVQTKAYTNIVKPKLSSIFLASSILACTLFSTSALADSKTNLTPTESKGLLFDKSLKANTWHISHGDDDSDSSDSSSADYQVGGTTKFFHDKSRPFDSLANSTASYSALPGGGIFLSILGSAFNGFLTLTDVPEATQSNSVRTIHTTIYYPVSKNVNCDDPLTVVEAGEGDLAYVVEAFAGIMSGIVPGFAANPEFLDGSMPGALVARTAAAAQNTILAECQNEAMAEGHFPLIFVSHGDGNNSYSEPARARALAQTGYVVVSMEHAGNSAGSLAPYDPKYATLNPDLANVIPPNTIYPRTQTIFEIRISQITNGILGGLGQPLVDNAIVREDKHLQERRADIRAIYKKLKRLNRKQSSMFYERLDLKNVGLTGGSHGGRTTLSVGENLDFIDAKAAFVIDQSNLRLSVSPSIVGSDPNSILLDVAAKELSSVKPTLLQTARQDNILYGFDLTDPNQAYQGNFDLVDNAQGPIQFSILDDANHSSAFLTLEEADPDLVRNTMCDIYDNTDQDPVSFNCTGGGLTYELKTPAEINAIWNTKTVAFFNLYLKRKSKACKMLISDEFESDGLEMVNKNIDCDDSSS